MKVKIHCSSCGKEGIANDIQYKDLEGEIFDSDFLIPDGWMEAACGYYGYYCSEKCYQSFLRKESEKGDGK